MGLYAGDPLAVDPWEVMAQMRPVVAAWFTAHILILDPNTSKATEYDPFADTGGDTIPGLLWDSGADGALLQPIRVTSMGDFGGQSVALVGMRIQTFVPPEVELRDGLIVKVLDGGNDHQLVNYRYVLSGGVSSSLTWAHILHAMVIPS